MAVSRRSGFPCLRPWPSGFLWLLLIRWTSLVSVRCWVDCRHKSVLVATARHRMMQTATSARKMDATNHGTVRRRRSRRGFCCCPGFLSGLLISTVFAPSSNDHNWRLPVETSRLGVGSLSAGCFSRRKLPGGYGRCRPRIKTTPNVAAPHTSAKYRLDMTTAKPTCPSPWGSVCSYHEVTSASMGKKLAGIVMAPTTNARASRFQVM